MYFYFYILACSSVLFISSWLIQALFLNDNPIKLPAAFRLIAGYFLIQVFFSASFKFFSIQTSWILGIALLLVQLIRNKGLPKKSFSDFKSLGVGIFLSVNLFFLPLHLAKTYGPFTEGGGDITIYADVAKFIVDHHLPVWGIDDTIEKWNSLKTLPIAQVGDSLKSLATFDSKLGNPPQGNYASYRVAKVRRYTSAMFARVAQWSFMAARENYFIFFSLLGFEYSLLLACAFAVLSRYGKKTAYMGVGIVAASHGLISLAYNHYLQQGMSLLVSMFLVGMITLKPAPFKGAWFGIPLAVILVFTGYPQYLSVIGPLLLLINLRDIKRNFKYSLFSPLTLFTCLFFLFWMISLIPEEASSTASVFDSSVGLLFHALGIGAKTLNSKEALTRLYFGNMVPLFSWNWLSFLFGQFSQQHLPPFVSTLPKSILISQILCAFSGGLILIFSIYTIYSIKNDKASRPDLYLFFVSVFIFTTNQLVAQSSLYLQAKASQNLLVILLFCLMLIPHGIMTSKKPQFRYLPLHTLALIIFGLSLIFPRLYFLNRISKQLDRSSILGPNYFEAAHSIVGQDPLAFVLFEPRSSSDVYLGTQALFTVRSVPTRHLILDQAKGKEKENWAPSPHNDNMIASDFIKKEDVSHLWRLSATHSTDDWRVQKINALKSDEIFLFGNQYEQKLNHYWLNRGTAFIALAPGKEPLALQLRIFDRHKDHLLLVRQALLEWQPNLNMRVGTDVLEINYKLNRESERFVQILSYDGELEFEAKINNQPELTQ